MADRIECLACGHLNSPDRQVCEECNFDLKRPAGVQERTIGPAAQPVQSTVRRRDWRSNPFVVGCLGLLVVGCIGLAAISSLGGRSGTRVAANVTAASTAVKTTAQAQPTETPIPTATAMSKDSMITMLVAAWESSDWESAIRIANQLKRQYPDEPEWAEKHRAALWNAATRAGDTGYSVVALNYLRTIQEEYPSAEVDAEMVRYIPTPTSTPEPTNTPSPSDVLSRVARDQFRGDLRSAKVTPINLSNLERILSGEQEATDASEPRPGDEVVRYATVDYNLGAQWDESMAIRSATMKAKEFIPKAFQVQGVDVLELRAFSDFTDVRGNSSPNVAMKITISRRTAGGINWPNFNQRNFERVLTGREDGVYVHLSLRRAWADYQSGR